MGEVAAKKPRLPAFLSVPVLASLIPTAPGVAFLAVTAPLAVALGLVPLLIVRTLRIVFIPMLLDGLILVGTVIAMPLGDDVDDFPSGTYLENLEDECESVGAAVEASKGGATSTMERAA